MRIRDTTTERRRTPRANRVAGVPPRVAAAIGAAAFGIGLLAVLAITHKPSGPGPGVSPAAVPSGPATFTLGGTLTLTPGQFWNDSGQCTGSTEYTDITYGDHVVVADQAGQTIGVGRLDAGSIHGDGADQTCVFILGVTVPDGVPFYKVSLAGRGSQTFTAEQAKAGITLSLGADG